MCHTCGRTYVLFAESRTISGSSKLAYAPCNVTLEYRIEWSEECEIKERIESLFTCRARKIKMTKERKRGKQTKKEGEMGDIFRKTNFAQEC